MKHSSFGATILVLDVEMSVFGAATSAIARRSIDAMISALDAETSAPGAATSAIAWSYQPIMEETLTSDKCISLFLISILYIYKI